MTKQQLREAIEKIEFPGPHGTVEIHPKNFKMTVGKLLAPETLDAILDRVDSYTETLRTDLARAMGHMEGCGHPDKYLVERYPELTERGGL